MHSDTYVFGKNSIWENSLIIYIFELISCCYDKIANKSKLLKHGII